jgi:ER lumen protein retaining receptor
MNIFRLAGDSIHVIAIGIILYQLHIKQNGKDISIKTQELLLVTYAARYLDLMTTYYSMYNCLMKVIYLTAAIWTLKMVHFPNGNLRCTITRAGDSFKHWKYIFLPCIIVVFFLPHGHSMLDFCWTFSILLEPFALVPQLYMIYNSHWDVEMKVKIYVWLISLYRAMYIVNWVYRSYHEMYYRHHYIVYTCGLIHALIVPGTLILDKLYPSSSHEGSGIDSEGNHSGPFIYHLI